MNTPTNHLFRKYLLAEASATGDWLRLGVMLVLLVLARLAPPPHTPATALPPQHFAPQYLLPVLADSSQLPTGKLAIYSTRYNTQNLLGRQASH